MGPLRHLLRGGERALFKALYFVTGNRHDAEELIQDAFLKLWERWDQIDRIEDPTGYLFRVALNGFRMRRRRAAMAVRKLDAGAGDRDGFLEAEMRADVRQLLLGLTPRQRAALLLVDLLGYPSEQAARILRVRPSTVRALATQGGGPSERRKERGMPDVQEVFRLATQKVRPDRGPGAAGRSGSGRRPGTVGWERSRWWRCSSRSRSPSSR